MSIIDPYPVYELDGLGARIGMPTCWDQWFPEVAHACLLGGANIVAYPTAIGSEPDHPGFDTQPLWQLVIVGNGIANGLFMIVPNRTGAESKPDGTPGNTFYGSSFVSDPYGRILVQAPRDEPCVLVADLDLAQREDWLDLFPFVRTRRPDTCGTLTEPLNPTRPLRRPVVARIRAHRQPVYRRSLHAPSRPAALSPERARPGRRRDGRVFRRAPASHRRAASSSLAGAAGGMMPGVAAR